MPINRSYFLAGSLLIFFVAMLSFGAPLAEGQAQMIGRWQTITTQMPINPVHAALMHNGKVLVVSGSGNLPSETNFMAGVFDPITQTMTTQPITWDMFCNGMVVLPDGRPFVMGGTLQYDPFHGELRTSVFDPATGSFADLQSMAHGRWYPTATTLGDGRVMVFSGLTETGGTNTTVEFYTVGSGWSAQFGAPWTPPLYPRMHLLPNGKVFYSGATTSSHLFDPATQTWSLNIAHTVFSGTRTYGTSVLLPLTPANGYKPQVVIMGGGNPATKTTETIDLSAATPQWVNGPTMSQPRIEMNATILPSGKVLVLGGSTNDEDTNTASLNADLYDPAGPSIVPAGAGANSFARLYHSNSLLLPDATVLVVGGNPARGTYEPRIEIYSPAYLFNSDGSLATRPTITNVAPAGAGYGTGFQVQTPDAASIASVVLLRAGAPTHAFDMDQRMVGLNFSMADANTLSVTGPPTSNIAPPGYYLLFILNAAGVPSVAKFVQVSNTPADNPPTATVNSPSGNVTILTGQSVLFSGSGTDTDGTISAYSWTFPGGSPATSSLANAGNVIYSAPGTYVATLTVTDNVGLTGTASRTITVQNPPTIVSLAVSPTAVTGGATSQGTVTLSAAALTAGITVALSSNNTGAATVPASVNIPSGSTSANFTVSTSSAASSTIVTITATYQGSQTATLTVNPAGIGGGGPTIDAQVSSDQPLASKTVMSGTFSTTSGNELLLAFVVTDYISGANTTVTNVTGGGLTWALVVRTNAQAGSSEIWRAFAPGMLNNATVTATLSQSVVASITVQSFTGVETTGTNGSGAIGATGSANGSSGAPTGTLKTTRNNSLVVGVGNDYDNAIVRTPGANQTVFHFYLTPTGDTYWMQRQNSVTPLSGINVTINDTAPTGDRYNLSIAEVLPPAVVVPTYTLSGTISPAANGSGTLITLSGGATATVNADASGNYSFSGLPNGNYTVTPTKSGFTYTPANQPVTINGGNQTAINFGIKPIPTYAVSGVISPAANGSGATVKLTGAATATVTADATGNYSISGLADGSYTVTPSKSGFSFTPASLAANVNNANVTAVNFTAQAATASSIAIDVAVWGDQNTASTTTATPLFSTTSANELLLAFVATDDLGTGNSIVVSNVSGAGVTWSLVVRSNTQRGTSEIWRAFSASPLNSVSVTATLSKSVAASITVMSFTGIDTTSPEGASAVGATRATNADAGAPSASLVTTRGNSLVVGVGNDYDSPILRTAGANQTLVHQFLPSVGDSYWVQRQNAVTPLSGTTVTINDTAPTGDRYNLAICEILAAR